MALVIAKKEPQQSKVMDHLARSLLASLVLTRGEAKEEGQLLTRLRISP